MIKVHKHLLTCQCDDCATMFPADRFEPTWVVPRPTDTAIEVTSSAPIGHRHAAARVRLWVEPLETLASDTSDPWSGRLAHDWPGMPATDGALVRVERYAGVWRVAATSDPILAALADPVPLRRLAAEKLSARCLVLFGLAQPSDADFIECSRHGHAGTAALTCRHVTAATTPPPETVLLYGVDGDFPDLFCLPCLDRYANGDVSACITVCSLCQRDNILRANIVRKTWYGAAADAVADGGPAE